MHNHLTPILVLIVLSALYLGHRLGLLGDRRLRWIGGGALLAAVILGLPFEGVDFVYLKRIKLFLAAGAALLPRGWSHWSDFRVNLETHVAVISPNVVGLTQVIGYRSGPAELTLEQFRELSQRRQAMHRVLLWVVFLPLLVLVARKAHRRCDLDACALALPLLFVGINLASYYYAFLVVLVLVHRRDPGRLALLFAAEVASYGLMLFEDREGLLFVYRSVVVGLLFAVLYLGPIRSGRGAKADP